MTSSPGIRQLLRRIGTVAVIVVLFTSLSGPAGSPGVYLEPSSTVRSEVGGNTAFDRVLSLADDAYASHVQYRKSVLARSQASPPNGWPHVAKHHIRLAMVAVPAGVVVPHTVTAG